MQSRPIIKYLQVGRLASIRPVITLLGQHVARAYQATSALRKYYQKWQNTSDMVARMPYVGTGMPLGATLVESDKATSLFTGLLQCVHRHGPTER